MPYKNLDEAITLAQMGKGSLVSSIATNDDKIAKEYVINAASHHGRIMVLIAIWLKKVQVMVRHYHI